MAPLLIPLWKKCRVLANALRLEMLVLIDQHTRLCVIEVADWLGVSEDIASKNLQRLQSVGFLQSERSGKYLFYTLSEGDVLANSVLAVLRSKKNEVSEVIFIATACTHERRVLIISKLKQGESDFLELCKKASIPRMPMSRHLGKLSRRGFVEIDDDGVCRMLKPAGELEKTLIEMAG